MRDLITSVIFAATCTALSFPATAGIYKYIDENGQVAYSDKPVDGAKKLKIRHRTRADERLARDDFRSERNTDASERNSDRDTEVTYESLEILTPKHDKVVSDRSGSVEVIVLPSPKLGEQHELVINVDGKDISRGRHANLSLSQVPRGSHKVTARILDANGGTLITSAPITFHVKRPVIDEDSPLAFDRN